jgi:hypothetical protein
MRNCFFLLFLTVLSFQSIGQNYRPGYVITLEGDTVRGEINSKNWTISPDGIQFRSGDNSKDFHALDIRGFVVDNERYTSAIVDIEVSSRDLSSLTYSRDFDIKKDTLFLHIIQQGTNTLYRSTNAKGIENFHIGLTDEIQLLKYKHYLVNSGGANPFFKENMFFTNQLNVYLGDCEDLKKKISSLRYIESDLIKLFALYDDCKGYTSDQTFTYKRKKGFPYLGAIGGITSATTKGVASNASFDNVTKANYDPSIDPAYGLFVGMTLPKKRSSIFLQVEFVFNSLQFGDSVTIETPGGSTRHYKTKLEISGISTNCLVGYSKNIGNLDLFVNSGIYFSPWNAKQNESLRYTIGNGTMAGPFESIALLLPKNDFGYLVGGGIKSKNIALQVRYQSSLGFGRLLEDLKMPLNRTSVFLSYSVPINKQ